MRIVKLQPNNKRLRQLIKEHGSLWWQIGPRERMQCFNNQMGTRIRSQDGLHDRNVLITDIEMVK